MIETSGVPAQHQPSHGSARAALMLSEAIGHGRARMLVLGLSENTVKNYVREAEWFGDWLAEQCGREPLLTDLNNANAYEFLLAKRDVFRGKGRDWARDTMEHYCGDLQAFGGHIEVACGLDTNPLAGLARTGASRTPRIRTGDALDDNKIIDVLGVLETGRSYDVVTRALFALGCEVGPRTSELVALDAKDFRYVSMNDTELGPVVEICSPAKGGRPRTVPLGAVAERFLLEAKGNRTAGPLFPGMDGERSTNSALSSRLRRAGKRVELALCPQRLRRSAASWQATYRASNGHLDTVFGWAPAPDDVKSGHYIIPTLAQLMYAHQRFFSPLDNVEARLQEVGRSLFG